MLLSQNNYDGAILSRIQAEYLIRNMEVTNLRRVEVDLMTRKYAVAVAEGTLVEIGIAGHRSLLGAGRIAC